MLGESPLTLPNLQLRLHNASHRLPAWADEAVQRRLAAVGRRARLLQDTGGLPIALQGGPLLNEILQRAYAKVRNEGS